MMIFLLTALLTPSHAGLWLPGMGLEPCSVPLLAEAGSRDQAQNIAQQTVIGMVVTNIEQAGDRFNVHGVVKWDNLEQRVVVHVVMGPGQRPMVTTAYE